jgi:hypothetical protein
MPDIFKPGQLVAQAADFGIQLVELPFMLGLPVFLAFAVILEQLREVLQGLLLPAVQLIRMNPAFRGDLGNAFIFAEHFQNNLRFLAGRYLFSLGHSYSNCAP